MTPHQVIAVAVRLFAVWLAVYVLRTVASFAFMGPREIPGVGVVVASLGLTAALAAALWFFPRLIAGKLLSPEAARPEGPASPDLWLAMGCALLGLWMLTFAVPSLVMDTYALVYVDAASDDSSLKRSVAYYVAEIAIALWLVFGAKGFRRLFWWAQNSGYKKAP